MMAPAAAGESAGAREHDAVQESLSGQAVGERAYPWLIQRPRRLRATSTLREMVAETRLDARQFIYPVFAVSGKGRCEEIEALPGQCRRSPDLLVREAEEAWQEGVRGY